MTSLFLAVLGCLALPILVAAQRPYCLAQDDSPYLRYGTKTAYEFVRGKDGNQFIIPHCTPVQFWGIFRDGARLPPPDIMRLIPELETFRDGVITNSEVRHTGGLCQADVENLRYWNKDRVVPLSLSRASDLTIQGVEDIKILAGRWQERFPKLFSTEYNPNDYKFRHSDSPQISQSIKAFVNAIVHRGNEVHYEPASYNESSYDPVTKCSAWQTEVNNNKTNEQANVFIQKEEYKMLLQNVTSRLGFLYSVDPKLIRAAYEICRYDKATEIAKPSPWCAAFTKENILLLEYLEDLTYYYKEGYGNPLSKKLGCKPIADLMKQFTDVIEHPDQPHPKALISFVNGSMIDLLVTALGAYEDPVPLTADNYHTPLIQRRKWRTSNINPFSANIVSVLYKCQQGEPNQVMFFQNENPMELQGCSVGLCNWSYLKNTFGNIGKTCNLEFCNDASKTAQSYLLLAIPLLSILFQFYY